MRIHKRINRKLLLLMSTIILPATLLLRATRDPRRIIQKGQHFELIDEHPNLLKYPPRSQFSLRKNTHLTIGDLHASALKLLYFLVRENILKISGADYFNFVAIYQKDSDTLTQTDIIQLNKIFKKIRSRAIPKGVKIRLIGDETADRDGNDYFTLLLFKKLAQEKVPFEILFSNHGYEFLRVYELGLKTHRSYLEENYARSLTQLRKLVNKELITLEEIDTLASHYYLPNITLVACTLQTTSFFLQACHALFKSYRHTRVTLFSHAPIGCNTIKALADHEALTTTYHDKTPNIFLKTIQNINQHFSKIVCDKSVYQTFGVEMEKAVDVANISLQTPILRTTWSRGYQIHDLPKPVFNCGTMFYVHGHDGNGKIAPEYADFTFNLDNHCGKGKGMETAPYTVLYSRNVIATTIQGGHDGKVDCTALATR